MRDAIWMGASVTLDEGCAIRRKLTDDDLSIWFETPSNSLDLYVTDGRMAARLRDLFAEAAEHFRVVDERSRRETDEEAVRQVP